MFTSSKDRLKPHQLFLLLLTSNTFYWYGICVVSQVISRCMGELLEGLHTVTEDGVRETSLFTA